MTIIKKIALSTALMSLTLLGSIATHASEVTGTLSSTASTPTGSSLTDGSIDGTVTSDSNSSSGGGSSGRSRSSSSNSPAGQVLGASTGPTLALATSPAFPNTGFGPGDTGFLWNITLGVITLLAILWVVLPQNRKRKKA